MHVIGLLHPRQTYLIQSGDREGTQQSFILWGGRVRREVQPPTLKYTVFD